MRLIGIIILTFLGVTMACSESEDHVILSVDVSEDAHPVHLDFDELPTEATTSQTKHQTSREIFIHQRLAPRENPVCVT